VHKDYTSGAPIQISVYAEKLMIWNSGRLPPKWTVERLLGKHASAPFNPDVANAFFRGGQIESWGRGIERMVQACLDAGLQAPVLQLEDGGVWVTFAFAHAPAKTSVKNSVKTSAKTSVEILRLLAAAPSMTLVEVAAQIGKTPRAIEMAASKLVKEGRLKHVGPQKGGHWEVTP
jgi:ATP-dependent DNA helicase RecG